MTTNSQVYRSRGIEDRLVEAVSSTPVVVLEGARAVGKTSVCEELIRRDQFAGRSSLDDDTTADQARRDLRGWLGALRTPAVIDEAQLIPELPLAVKDLVDRRGPSAKFVLTGSASIGRDALGGRDPLAGRSVRIGLRPFSQLELGRGDQPGRVPSVVDAMFGAAPVPGARLQPIDRGDVTRRMEIGGFPLHAIGAGGATSSRRLRRDRIETDLTDALSHVRIGDERFDVFRAQRLAEAIVAEPGGILNVSRLAGELNMARPTVDAYLGHLERRYLIHRLPNFGGRPRAQAVGTARPKMHPVDVSLSVAVLDRMGRSLRVRGELFGAVFESFVVNEIIAQATWARVAPDIGYWRDTGKRGDAEVDLVLLDGIGRSVGIEVKSSTTVRESDAAGLLAMRSSSLGLIRGFVVHLGTDVVSLGEDLWGVPFSWLTDPDAWRPEREAVPPTRPTPLPNREDSPMSGPTAVTPVDVRPPAASVFVSYVHADDEYESGAIRRLVERLAETYEFLFGEKLELFIDRDIRWGERWANRIAVELEQTTFLLAVVTPRFLTSDSCRDEVAQFATTTRHPDQRRLLLPLIWRRPPTLDSSSADSVVQHLAEAQWEDVGDLRFADPAGDDYRRRLEELAERLHGSLVIADVSAAAIEPADLEEPDDLERMVGLHDAMEALGAEDFPALTAALNRVGADLAQVGRPIEPSNPRSVQAWASRTADLLEPATADLGRAIDGLRTRWAQLDDGIGWMIPWSARRAAAAEDDEMTNFWEQVSGLHRSFDEVLGSPDLAGLGDILPQVAALSRRLRPLANSVQAALTLLTEMRDTTQSWLRLGNRSGPTTV